MTVQEDYKTTIWTLREATKDLNKKIRERDDVIMDLNQRIEQLQLNNISIEAQ